MFELGQIHVVAFEPPVALLDAPLTGRRRVVQEACVIGIPDERWGESVKAFVVVRPGHSLTAGEVVDWCRSRLASYKKPRYVEFLSAADVPRSVTGKILRGDLARRPTTPDQVVQTTRA